MRVLVTSIAGTGHVLPLVPMARALVDGGHDVVWATPPDGCPKVESHGLRAVAAGLSSDEAAEALAPRAPELAALAELPARQRQTVGLPIIFGGVMAEAMGRDLEPIVDEVRPDLVLHDLVELAAPPVAAARGIPHVCLAFGLAPDPALLTAMADAVAGHWQARGLDPSPTAGLFDDLYLHPVPAGLGPPPDPDVTRSIRPLHADGGEAGDAPAWAAGFGADRPGLYVTFGTAKGAARAPFGALAEALAELDADVVVTMGGLDPSLLGPTPANVRVEGYVPQRFLLERAAGVVSHAGSGTLWATAAQGIPQVCLPFGADQWDNADAVSGAGAGITLEEDQRDAAALHGALVELLGRTDLADAAAGLATAFEALPLPADRVGDLVALAG